ncbi:hypothetical protein D9M70_614080 [compost metagenome]
MQVGDAEDVLGQQLRHHRLPHLDGQWLHPLGRIDVGDLGEIRLSLVQGSLARIAGQRLLRSGFGSPARAPLDPWHRRNSWISFFAGV